MRVKLGAQCPYTRRVWQAITILTRFFTFAPTTTASKGRAPTSTHAKPRGGKNAQQFQIYRRRRSQALPDLRRKIRPRQALLLADRALFKEVR